MTPPLVPSWLPGGIATLGEVFSFNCNDNPFEHTLESLQAEMGSPDAPVVVGRLARPPSLKELAASALASGCGRPGYPLLDDQLAAAVPFELRFV